MKLTDQWRAYQTEQDVPLPEGDALGDAMADLLDECETLIVAMRQEIQNLGGSLEGVITADATLAKLRAAQEIADEVDAD